MFCFFEIERQKLILERIEQRRQAILSELHAPPAIDEDHRHNQPGGLPLVPA